MKGFSIIPKINVSKVVISIEIMAFSFIIRQKEGGKSMESQRWKLLKF